MADSILFVADYVVDSTPQELTCSFFLRTDQPHSNEVIYVLDFELANSGSVQFLQNQGDTEGEMLKSDSLARAETRSWRVDTHPRWLYASGSNEIPVRLTSILNKK